MKKVLYIAACLLEVLLVAGSYVFNYFTKSKMGMARFVIFKNQTWLSKYPLEQWKVAVVLGIVALTAFAAVIFWKRKRFASAIAKVDLALAAILSGSYAGFTLSFSMDKLRAYYFISLMLGLGALIQVAKLLVQALGMRKEHR